MAEYHLRNKDTKEDFETLVEGLRKEAEHRGWEETFDSVMSEAGVRHLVKNRLTIGGRVRFPVNANLLGDLGVELARVAGEARWRVMEVFLEMPPRLTGLLSECVCPETKAGAARMLKDWAMEEFGNRHRQAENIAWIDPVEDSMTFDCSASNCRNN